MEKMDLGWGFEMRIEKGYFMVPIQDSDDLIHDDSYYFIYKNPDNSQYYTVIVYGDDIYKQKIKDEFLVR